MITIELNENSAKDFKLIQKMRKEGIPEDFIQKVYDITQENRKKASSEDSD